MVVTVAWLLIIYTGAGNFMNVTYSPPVDDEASCIRMLEAYRAQTFYGKDAGRCVRVSLIK